MGAPKRKLKITKVPLGYKPEIKPINFGPMPQLYLELLENKDRVREDLKDKLYEPKWNSTQMQHVVISNHQLNQELDIAGQDFKQSCSEFDSDGVLKDLQFIRAPYQPLQQQQTYETSEFHPDFSDPYASQEHFEYDYDPIATSASAAPPSSDDLVTQVISEGFLRPYTEVVNDRNSPHGSMQKYTEELPMQRMSSKPTMSSYSHTSHASSRSPAKEVERDGLEQFLTADLEEPKPSANVYNPPPSNHQKTRIPPPKKSEYPAFTHPQKRYPQPPPQPSAHPQQPPGLQTLRENAARVSGKLDISQTSKTEEQKATRKSDLLYKFKRLKQLYKNATIPEFNEFTDLETLEREFANIEKYLAIDSNVENYKRYLTMGFGVVEFLVSRFLKLPEINGFTAQQMVNMNQYEQILFEIGEKHKPKPGKGLPPELKLIGIMIFNAAIFVGMKILMNGGGNAIFNSTIAPNIGGVNTAPSSSGSTSGSKPSVSNQPGRKPMKSPDFNVDDLF
jgi:hypothetical protein